MNGQSTDIKQQQIKTLKSSFPEVFAEGKIDFDKLKHILGEVVETDIERYGLSWAGKSGCFMEIQTPTTKTLQPQPEQSVDFDTSQNMFIEGDNLDVLKVLQKSYYKKVKMIYIDPPYNTGNDFIYFDKFKENQDDYLKASGERDDDGNARKTFRKNSKESGHYHSNWMNMMYPRLFLAKNVLREDGVIFVSIDDNEVHNLRLMMNEIFGEENFVASFLWRKKGTTTNVEGATVSSLTEYILCYGKSENGLNLRITSTQDRLYPHHDALGNYRITVIEKKNIGDYERQTMVFPIMGIVPRNGKRWQIGEAKARELELKNRFITENEIVKLKIYDFEDKDTTSANPNLLFDYGSTASATIVLKELLNGSYFDNPKPIELIKKLISLAQSEDKNDIVLDFFAGSGTTAQAVMELNQEDGGHRKFILVQLPEVVADDSEAHKAGYVTIADISRERIRRVIAKLKKSDTVQSDVIPSVVEGSPVDAEKISRQARNDNTVNVSNSLNFKSFLLTPSNFKIWRGDDIRDEETLLARIEDSIDNIKPDSKKYNMLYELLIKQGIEPTAPIEDKGDYFIIGDVIVCFAEPMTQEIITRIIAEKPQTALFIDRSFHGNPQLKTNAFLQMRDNKIEFKVI
jgi:adenine-specific DNA-methyltransferase